MPNDVSAIQARKKRVASLWCSTISEIASLPPSLTATDHNGSLVAQGRINFQQSGEIIAPGHKSSTAQHWASLLAVTGERRSLPPIGPPGAGLSSLRHSQRATTLTTVLLAQVTPSVCRPCGSLVAHRSHGQGLRTASHKRRDSHHRLPSSIVSRAQGLEHETRPNRQT